MNDEGEILRDGHIQHSPQSKLLVEAEKHTNQFVIVHDLVNTLWDRFIFQRDLQLLQRCNVTGPQNLELNVD